MKLSFAKTGNLCGILAPLLWAASIVLCGALRPEYNYYTQYISELGERGSSTEILMRYAGFVPTGLMHIVFAIYLYSAIKGSRLALLAAILVGVNGIGRIGAGLFPCEPGCISLDEARNQQLHHLFATIGFFAIIGATLLWGFLMRKHQSLRALTLFSFVCGILGLAFLLLMVNSDALRAGTGLYERLSSGVLSFWVLIFAVRLRSLRLNGLLPIWLGSNNTS